MRWWKVLGLAGVVGVTVTGVLPGQAARRHQARPPAEIRKRLHQRPVEAAARSTG